MGADQGPLSLINLDGGNMFAGQLRGSLFFILLASFLLVSAGCSEDEKSIAGPGPDPLSDLPFPGSPDVVMQNFQTSYETRDFDEFKLIMAPEFETILQQSTVQDFPDVGETLDLTEELRIHERMFSWDPVTDPDGDLVPGIHGISFSRFINLETWADSAPTDPFPDSKWALYDVRFLFDRGQTFSTLKVEGTIKFYVTSRDSLHEDVLRQYYQMIGQVDLTSRNGKVVENVLWGSAKAIYR